MPGAMGPSAIRLWRERRRVTLLVVLDRNLRADTTARADPALIEDGMPSPRDPAPRTFWSPAPSRPGCEEAA